MRNRFTSQTTVKQIHNKRIAKQIQTFFTTEVINDLNWDDAGHRENTVRFVEDYIHNMFEQDQNGRAEITQVDVRCDSRNNTTEQLRTKNYQFTISYRQWNCLTTTEICFSITPA